MGTLDWIQQQAFAVRRENGGRPVSGDDGDLFGFGRAVLDRLDRIIELLEQPQINEEDSNDEQREQDNSKKRRGVSPAAYRTNGIKVLTSLLSAPNPNVGKLAVSLERENNINHSMVTAILRSEERRVGKECRL